MAKKSAPTDLKPAKIADAKIMRGSGGETHQIAGGDVAVMTTQQGIPVSDEQNSLRVGERTPAFMRISTVAGNKGSTDLAGDVRGFAVKLYTQQGNWDIVGNNIPVFFIQDAIKFPDLINAAGKSTYVKFHWKPKLGMQSVCWNEAVKINGADPDFHRRDMWAAIQGGDFPEWELGLQLLDDAFADRFEFDVLDPTKLIPEEQVPIGIVGRLVLDRVVDNFFAETEQVAFCTANIVPGVDFTNDPLLQGRNFSYLDTQLKRSGQPNFTHIPIKPQNVRFTHFRRTGIWRCTTPKAGRITSRIPGGRKSADRASRPRMVSPRCRWRRAGRNCASADRYSPIIIARRGSSSSARPRPSRRISRTPSCSS